MASTRVYPALISDMKMFIFSWIQYGVSSKMHTDIECNIICSIGCGLDNPCTWSHMVFQYFVLYVEITDRRNKPRDFSDKRKERGWT